VQPLKLSRSRALPYVPTVSFDEVRKVCECFYERDGYVSWALVAKAFGVSRQAIQARVKSAVTSGTLDPATYERWLSVSSRRAVTRERREAARAEEKLTVTITLTPENWRWLRTECALRNATNSDLINGLINKAREGRE
jgi:predicted DNA-binding protein YlxM (UPF0122 family)